MEKKNIVIVIPGFEYDSNGPVYIDKIKIDASINGEPIDVYTHELSYDKAINSEGIWNDIQPNNIVYNKVLFDNIQSSGDNKRQYNNDQVTDLIIASQVIPYSETLASQDKVPYSFFNDILEIKDGVYHHYLTVYNSSDIQTRQNDYKEHDGICWLALDEINTDIIFNITFYSFVGENNNYKTDNNYVIIGQKTMYYNPATSGYEGGQVDFCGLSFQQYYDITDQTKGYTVELEDPIVYEDDENVKKICKYTPAGYIQTQNTLYDELCINIYPQWGVSQNRDRPNSFKWESNEHGYSIQTDSNVVVHTFAPSEMDQRIYTTATLAGSNSNITNTNIVPLVMKHPGVWGSLTDNGAVNALKYQQNYFNNLPNNTGLSAFDLISKGVLKSNIIFSEKSSQGNWNNTPFDIWANEHWISLYSQGQQQYGESVRVGNTWLALVGVMYRQSTARLSRYNDLATYPWPFCPDSERGKSQLIKDSKLIVGPKRKSYDYTIINSSTLYNSTYIYKNPIVISVKNLSETPSYMLKPDGSSGEAQTRVYVNDTVISELSKCPCRAQDRYDNYQVSSYNGMVTYVYPIKQEDIIDREIFITPDEFATKLSNIKIKLDTLYFDGGGYNYLYNNNGTYWLPNTLFAVDLDRSKLTFSQDSTYKIKPQYVYTTNGIYKGLYKSTGKDILVNSNVDTTINYLTDQDDSNLEWLVGQENLKTPIEMGYNCSYYNEKDFYWLKDNWEYTLDINRSITLESGLYTFNCNFISGTTSTCKLDVYIGGEKHELNAVDQTLNSRKLICFYLKNKTTVTISKLTISNRSRYVKDIYIRNIGLYKVDLDDESLYSELFKQGFGIPKNDFTDLNTGEFIDLINFIIFPACYVYDEFHKCFENAYNFTWLPDKPMYKIEGSYTLTNDYKDKVSNVATQSLDAFGSPITIRE